MNIKYVSGVSGAEYDLCKPPFAIKLEPLFNWKWEYESKTIGKWNKIVQFKKGITETQYTLLIQGEDTGKVLQHFLRDCEKDIRNKKVGRLVTDNNYYLPCYITASDYKYWQYKAGCVECVITVTAEKPFWRNEKSYSFFKGESLIKTGDFAYPYDYPYNYYMNNNSKWLASDGGAIYYKLVINGYAKNPSVKIGDMVVKVKAEVAVGEYLVVDSETKTILLYKADGTTVNCFGMRDFNYYIFNPIEEDNIEVNYDGSFEFTLTLIREVSAAWETNTI